MNKTMQTQKRNWSMVQCFKSHCGIDNTLLSTRLWTPSSCFCSSQGITHNTYYYQPKYIDKHSIKTMVIRFVYNFVLLVYNKM